VALDIGYISTHVFDEINTLAQEVARLIGGLKSSVYKAKLKK
jgi:hypothetical protein